MSITTYKTLLVKDSATNYELKSNRSSMINNMEEAGAILRELFHASELCTEQMWEICLNAKGRIIGVFELATDTQYQCFCDTAAIARNALLCNAFGVIIAHNHPSGDSTPSDADIDTTKKVKAALRLVDIQLFDHIIIGERNHSMCAARQL